MTHPSSKTAYILGAGFSHDAGCPLQAEILKQVMDFDLKNLDILDTHIDFRESRETFSKFFEESFAADTLPSLEDIFTLLDQTIETRGMCHGFTWKELEDVRRALNRCILFIFHWTAANSSVPARDFYRSLACYLLHERIRVGQPADPLCVISLNWDSLLEDELYWCIKQIGATRKIDIDYCCYTTPLYKSSPHTPSPAQKPSGLFNFKLMKLHGSANWLSCPNCSRLFTGVGEERTSWDLYVRLRACPSCSNTPSIGGSVYTSGPTLEPFFISPTFLKRFASPHIQMAWHNAFIDISEADHIVIIGYSLPEADYLVRTLLRRAMKKDISVTAVLASQDREHDRRNKKHEARVTKRYEDFFGRDKVVFNFSGVRGYFSPIIGRQTLGRRVGNLKRALKRDRSQDLSL